MAIALPAVLWVLLALGPASPSSRQARNAVGDGPIGLFGVLVGPDGATVARASGTLYSEFEGAPRATALLVPDPDGRFLVTGLEPGLWHIVATTGDGGGQVGSATITIVGAGLAGPLRIELASPVSLGGRVTSTSGAPIGARVRVVPEPLPGDPTNAPPFFEPRILVASPDGRFEAIGLPAGSCRIDFSADGYLPAKLSRVMAPCGDVAVELVELSGIDVSVVTDGPSGLDRVPAEGAQVKLFAPGAGVLREARTDAHGLASFRSLAPGTYQVDASRADLLAWKPVETVIVEGTIASAEIVLRPGLALEGLVTDLDGALPVSGACVVASSRSETGRIACATTDEQGRFRLAGLVPGKWAVVVMASGYLRQRLPIVTMEKNQVAGSIQITLSPSLVIEGTVRDPGGAPVAGARVFADGAQGLSSSLFEGFLDMHLPSLLISDPSVIAVGELGVTLGPVPPIPIDPPSTIARSTLPGPLGLAAAGCGCLASSGASATGTAVTAEDGAFLLTGIPAGEVTLVLVHPSYATLRWGPILAAEGPIALTLDPGGTLGGTVLSSSGSPVDGALVWIEGASTMLAEPFVVGPDGAWRAAHVVGPVKVSASNPGWLTASVEVTAISGASSLGIDLVLEPEGELVRARVLDVWGYPLEGALVEVSAGTGASAQTRSARTDGDGIAVIPSLPGDSWTILVSHPSWRTLRTVIEPWESWQEPTLQLESAAGVSGTVRNGWSHDPMQEFTLTLECQGSTVAHARFESGDFILRDLPSGKCWLRVEAFGFESLVREVLLPPGDGPADVTLQGLELWLDPVDPGS